MAGTESKNERNVHVAAHDVCAAERVFGIRWRIWQSWSRYDTVQILRFTKISRFLNDYGTMATFPFQVGHHG